MKPNRKDCRIWKMHFLMADNAAGMVCRSWGTGKWRCKPHGPHPLARSPWPTGPVLSSGCWKPGQEDLGKEAFMPPVLPSDKTNNGSRPVGFDPASGMGTKGAST